MEDLCFCWFFLVLEQHSAAGCDIRVAGSGFATMRSLSLPRDGGLKREKVKDAFKEEQQKLYSKMIVGSHEDRSRS